MIDEKGNYKAHYTVSYYGYLVPGDVWNDWNNHGFTAFANVEELILRYGTISDLHLSVRDNETDVELFNADWFCKNGKNGHRTAWEGWLHGAKKVPWELMKQMTDQEIKELYDCDNDLYFDWGVMYFATKYCM